MRLQVFRSLWSNRFNLDSALADLGGGAFEGVEGPAPAASADRRKFSAKLASAGAPFIAEIATGGGYVPLDTSPERQLEEFNRRAEAALECSPLFLTVMAGCDGWELSRSVDFFGRLIRQADGLGIVASIETHRSRPTFTPWATRDLLRQLPDMRLTCDFSHWCCVCERLVLDDEPEILALCAERAHHTHARVGYEQGPQVPHPAAPLHRPALEAHERWWDAIWQAQPNRDSFTLTPEFGPDGYLHTEPFTAAPVAVLDEINRWVSLREQGRFAARRRPAVSR